MKLVPVLQGSRQTPDHRLDLSELIVWEDQRWSAIEITGIELLQPL